ncbi:hypothetical protein JYU34_007811 [Plutella xylostella]|uniref:Hemimethylated DNA-binding domain-containing protein n=1 Tax=Plutella xylostella TaxID=51655 RepID=A0ABQ7QRE5_PLUXY|nr:hypothetical protein JYU34_007811 [Plutella xylostella]
MESEPVNYFMYLPDELIYLILGDKVLNNTDVLNFGATCKSYHELVLSDPSLWKRKLKTSLKPDVFEVIEQHCDGNWLQQATSYYTLRKTLHTEIANMSPKFFWRQTDITMDDMADVIKYALVNNINYYLCISILSEIVRKEHNIVGWIWIPEKPYRLTDVHYAKIVLRYLFHNYLMIKDAQMQRMNDLAPEKILHFFLQWTDTSMVYEYEEIDNKLTELAEQVLQLLEPTHPARRSDPAARAAWAQQLEDNQWNPQDSGKVLAALAQRLFKERRVSVADGANLETLNITRYRTTYHPLSTPAYVINLNTGDIGKKQQCPFSSGVNDGDIKYNSKSLLDYLARVFRENMGAIQNCNSENLVLLSPLLPAGQERGEYRPLAPLVARRIADPARASFVADDLINLKSMDESYREIIWMLTNTQQHDNKITRKPVVKQHSQSGLLYCVGMVCYHLQYEYVGVVRGWDARCQAPPMWQERMRVHELAAGAQQPFYSVLAADYSSRYVAQENLREMAEPTRLYHLEEKLARDFSHFDGFAYVPNEEKESEYPGDAPVREAYRTHLSREKEPEYPGDAPVREAYCTHLSREKEREYPGDAPVREAYRTHLDRMLY